MSEPDRMHGAPRPFAVGWAMALVGTVMATCTVSAEPRPQIVGVVDGSGSMWGGIGDEGVSKLAAVRQALETTLPGLAASHRLGLATFGPGCRAADLVVPPDTRDADSVVAPLVKFNPRGKGPLVAGLRAAAGSFDAQAGGTIVLFHDGLDNCGEDACKAAAEIHGKSPKLVIHTISLVMETSEIAAIACVSKTTGGRSFAAGQPSDVERAMAEIAAAATALQVAAAPPPPAPAAPMPAPKTAGPPRLVASAVLAAGKAPYNGTLSWKVSDPATGATLGESVAPTLTLPLRPGKARIDVTGGRVTARVDVDIAEAGDTLAVVPLQAGVVRFDTGAKRLASDAEEPTIRLERLAAANPPAAGDAKQVATPLWISRGKSIEALLPPGAYRAVAEYGLARAAATVSVEAGSDASLALPLEAGRLELAIKSPRETGVVYRIAVDDPDRPGGRREIARSAFATPGFVLATGSYYVTVDAGGHESRKLVAVRSGEVTRETFAIDPARLTVEPTLNGAPAGREPLSVSISAARRSGAPVPSPVSLVPGRAWELAPGNYTITIRHGDLGASAAREVELAAGQEQKVTVDLKAGILELDMHGIEGGARCTLADRGGRTVWRTAEASARAVLDPGTYAVSCEASGQIRSGSVALAAGESKRLKPFSP